MIGRQTVRSVNGASNTVVCGNYPASTNRCFNMVHPNAVVDGFTITNGCAPNEGGRGVGGGVLMAGGILRNCLITGNSAPDWSINTHSDGGGVYCQYGRFTNTIENCTIIGNSAEESGGGLEVESFGLTVVGNSKICDNSA